ncbi:MAG: hypothetical protein JNM07_00990 [Phycisphaerae bacterium]|nr:hypothetical protein [Phycisphaerae bacterium]
MLRKKCLPSHVTRSLRIRPWVLSSVAGLAISVTPVSAWVERLQPTDPPKTTPAGAPAGAVQSPPPGSKENPAPTPEGAPSAQEAPKLAPTQAVVLAVQGKVEYRTGPSAAWQPAKVGVVVGQGAAFRTGARSAIQIKVGTGQTLTIDRTGLIGLDEAIKIGSTEKTTITVPYGRVKFDIKSTETRNDVKIVAPDATLAVIGTEGAMEVTPGQPTLAYGGEFNQGTIAVAYTSGVMATLVRDHSTSSDKPDPVYRADDLIDVEVGDRRARDIDETKASQRAAGGTNPSSASAPPSSGEADTNPPQPDTGTPPPPTPEPPPQPPQPPEPPTATDSFLFFDELTRQLVERKLNGTQRTLRVLESQTNSTVGGLAVLADTSRNRRDLLSLRPRAVGSQVSNELFGLSLDDEASTFQLLDSFTGQGNQLLTLGGLGTIGTEVFASTLDDSGDFADRVLRLDIGRSGVLPLMAPGLSFEGGLAGSNDRGSLFLMGHLPAAEGGQGGATFPDLALLEVDPRANYVRFALTEAQSAFVPSADTVIVPSDFDVRAIEQVTGLAWVGDRLIISAIAVDDQNVKRGVLIEYNPGATGGSGDPRVIRVEVTGRVFVNGLASEGLQAPPGVPTLRGPSGPIDDRINPLFAAMAYSQQALSSGYVGRVSRAAILATARDAALCLNTGALANLGFFLAQHIDQVAGIGLSAAQFRFSLPADHPCLAVGQGIVGPVFFFLNRNAGLLQLQQANVQGQRGGVGTMFADHQPASAAVRFDQSDPSYDYLMLAPRDDASGVFGDVYRIPIDSAFSDPILERSYQAFSSSGRPIEFTGLGALGGELLATGFARGASGPREFRDGIIDLGTRSSPVAQPIMDLRLATGFGAASVNELGAFSIITAGSRTARGRGSFSLIETDPRARLIITAFRGDRGDFEPTADTTFDPPGFDINSITEFTSLARVGDVYLIAARALAADGSVTNVLIEYASGATNGNGDPRVRRVAVNPDPGFVARSIAAQRRADPIAVPVISDPPGPVDTETISPLFAQLAYTQSALDSGLIEALLRQHVVETSADPAAAAASPAMASLSSLLGSHVNQTSGIGRATADFRGGLLSGHPALAPGQSLAGGTFLYLATEDLTSPTFVVPMIERNLAGDRRSISPLLSVNDDIDFSGIAFRPGTAGAELLRLDSAASASSIRSRGTGVPGSPFVQLDSYSQGGLRGLGTLGSRAFTQAGGAGAFGLSELLVQPGVVTPRISLTGQFRSAASGLAGANERGTLFTLGGVGTHLTTLFDRFLLEVDPRNNSIVRVIPFSIDSGTLIQPGGFPVADLTEASGLAFVDGRLVVGAVSPDNVRAAFITFDPDAAPGTRMLRIDGAPAGLRLSDFAGETNAAPPASAALDNPPGQIDTTTIDPLFALLGYSPQAAQTTFLNDLVRAHLVVTSRDPALCAVSSSLSQVPPLLLTHASQVGGVGRTIGDFRGSLLEGHPCLAPGQQGQLAAYFILAPAFGNSSDAVPTVLRAYSGQGAFEARGTFLSPNLLGAGSEPKQYTDAALFFNPQSSRRELLALTVLISGGSRIYPLGLDSPGQGFGSPINFGPTSGLTSIGSLGTRVYVNGLAGGLGDALSESFLGISEADLTVGKVRPRVSLGASAQFTSALSGWNERGTLVLPISPRLNGGTLDLDGAIVEIDPRNRLIVSAQSGLFADFATGANTVFVPPSYRFDSINDVTGIVPLADGRLVFTATTHPAGGGDGEEAFVRFTFNPNVASGLSKFERVEVISDPALIVSDIAGESLATPPQPVALAPPATPSETFVNFGQGKVRDPAFLSDSAYLDSARVRSVVTDLIVTQVLQHADDLSACFASGELATIPGYVASHPLQQGGVGQATGDFYRRLPSRHPCRPNLSAADFVTIDGVSTPSLAFVDSSYAVTLGPAVTGLNPSLIDDHALISDPAGDALTMLTVENQSDGSGGAFATIKQADLLASPSPNFATVAFIQVPGNGGRGIYGLATIGNQVFGATDVDFQNLYSEINRVDIASGGTLTPVVGLPMRLDAGLIGSNERGTLFAVGVASNSAEGAPQTNLLSNAVLIEIDPRNNLLINGRSAAQSELAATVDTDNPSQISTGLLGQISAVGYVRGNVVLSGEPGGGTPVLVEVSMEATGNPGDPKVVSIYSSSGVNQRGGASERPIRPLAPISIPNPPGTIDTRGLNATFAQMAYTQRAFDSGVPTQLIRSAIITAARDPVGCSQSSELFGVLPANVQTHINKVAGVGRAVSDFRQSIPPGHPCQPN